MLDPEFLQKVASFAAVVIGSTEVLKKKLKLRGIGTVIVSVLVSLVVCIPSLKEGIINYILIAGAVSLAANGLFKFINKSGF
ncbi:MAG: hypothetical protein P8078_00170 [bacterium]